MTIFTFDDAGAFHAVIVSSGLINGAGLISDIVVMHPIVSIDWLTTMAPIILCLTGNYHLWGDIDIGPRRVSSYLDSI